jgi:sarcosine oxidase
VGLGAAGSAALYHSAKLGARAIGIDRFHPPHDLGSSHGETRITRQAIGEGRDYVPLVLRSNQIWQELESVTGRSLLTRNGALILTSPHTAGNHHGSTSFLADTVATATEYAIEHAILSTQEIRQRFPQFRLEHNETAYFEPGAGFLRPELCIDTQLSLARQLGAEVRTGEAVYQVSTHGTSAEVVSDKGTYTASSVIVTAGPWIAKLLPFRIAQDLRVYRQVMSWFALARNHDRYTPDRFPVFIWITGEEPSDMMYGFPAIDGPANGVKVATERYEDTVDPDEVSRSVDAEETNSLYENYIASRLPDVSPACVQSAVCMYTVAPHARFVIDKADTHGHILFASACSGHGFKHSSAVGEALARRALGLEPIVDLSPFARRESKATAEQI